MIIQCGWCNKLLGEKEPFQNMSITHTICEICQKKLLAKCVSKEVKHEAA